MRSLCHAGRVSARHQIQGLMALLATMSCAAAPLTAPQLENIRRQTNGWVQLDSSFHPNAVLALEASTNLNAWSTIGTLHDALFNYPDAAAPTDRQRFYRLRASGRGPMDDWKNQIWFPDEPFKSVDFAESVHFVKFAILLNEPARVVYQHSTN